VSSVAFDGWAPVEQHDTDLVPAGAAAAMHSLLDAPGDPPRTGDPLPTLWHWMAFVPRVPQSQLGADGHPAKGTFLPPVPLPRRMFAGATLDLPTPIAVGEPIHRRGVVSSVEEKTGRSGSLVFVKVAYDYDAGGASAISEVQDIVYREPVPGSGDRATSPSPDLVPDEWTWARDVEITPTLLFRFSALTYNAHRIHYDREYATAVEGYPGLVVHGPFQAVALAELCRRHAPDRRLTRFEFRAVGPAFDDGPLLLRGRPDNDRVTLAAFDHHGRQTVKAHAAWELDGSQARTEQE